MEKVETITRHRSGNPHIENSKITWIEFLIYCPPLTEADMYDVAIALLSGGFIHSGGYTYYLTGINLRD